MTFPGAAALQMPDVLNSDRGGENRVDITSLAFPLQRGPPRRSMILVRSRRSQLVREAASNNVSDLPPPALCVQHAMRRYNEQTSNGEFDVELRADGSDTVLELKEKISVRRRSLRSFPIRARAVAVSTADVRRSTRIHAGRGGRQAERREPPRRVRAQRHDPRRAARG